MKNLHIVPSYLTTVRYGGPIVSVHGLCHALVGKGHQVDVYTTLTAGDCDLDIDSGVRVDIDAVGVYYYPATAPHRWYYSAQMSAALHANVHDYDIVHIHALFLHPISTAAIAARRASIPYLVSPRGVLVHSLFEQRSHWLKSAWMATFGRRVLEQAAAVHVTSAPERDEIGAFKLKLARMIEIPNGTDAILRATSNPPRDKNLVPFLGRLSWKKQIDRMIDAMVACPLLTLVVVGNDDEGLLPSLCA
jgi:glycosyltransferase involved in cell wall biosynthesis